MKIENIMSAPVVTCFPENTLNQAAQLMWENDCGCLPVVNREGELVGIITDRDICMAAYTRGTLLSDATVASVMSQSVVCCQTEDGIGLVEQLMKGRKVRRIPVLDELGALAGIVTVGDLARDAEAHGLRGTVKAPGITRTLAVICEPRRQPASATN